MARLRLMRLDGDRLKVDLAEAALNDLLERYLKAHSCHTCHGSQPKEGNDG